MGRYVIAAFAKLTLTRSPQPCPHRYPRKNIGLIPSFLPDETLFALPARFDGLQ